MKHIIIIGNGISGITAARHIRKQSDHAVTVISSESDYFFSRTALMYVYMGHLQFQHTRPYEDWFWKKNKIDLVRDHVERIDIGPKSLRLRSGKTISYDSLVIATGSRSNWLGWPGENLPGVQGLYSYQDLQLMDQNTKGISHAVIVGGGLIGIEMAEMLQSRNISVTFLVREPEFWSIVLPLQEASMISRHIREHHVELLLNTELREILANDRGRARAVVTGDGRKINCEFVGLTVGVSPNIDFLKGSGVETNRGVLVNDYLETNVPGVYALGDCVERRYMLPGRKTIEQVWYTGRMMGEVLARTLCGNKTKYEPGPWFNSAKFFDIEYQTYGDVGNVLRDNESEFYWEHKSGTRSMHFVWNKNNGQFTGINAFGMRLRHECFDRWLREKRSIRFVMSHLREANFDPELFMRHEREIEQAFENSCPAPITVS